MSAITKPIALDETLQRVAGALEIISGDINLIAPKYEDLTFPVSEGDYCIYENELYKANDDISTTEVFTPAHWDATNVGDEIKGATGSIADVRVNGSSVVTNGIADVPMASDSEAGVVKVIGHGLQQRTENNNTFISTDPAPSSAIKGGAQIWQPITPKYQHESAFYGIAKAAGDSTQSASDNVVGTYTESAKSKISEMLNAPETVSGTTPSITAKPGVRYICGECSTLSITAPASGCIDVVFESGSTPTVLTVASAKTGVTAIKWANGFDPTSLDANTVYEINILDGEFGVVGSWT